MFCIRHLLAQDRIIKLNGHPTSLLMHSSFADKTEVLSGSLKNNFCTVNLVSKFQLRNLKLRLRLIIKSFIKNDLPAKDLFNKDKFNVLKTFFAN